VAKNGLSNLRSIYKIELKRRRVDLGVAEEVGAYAVPRSPVSCSANAAKVASKLIGDELVEVVIVLLLDARNSVIGYSEVGRGSVSSCSVQPVSALRPVVASGAAAFILSHNHPSGSTAPSAEDNKLTARLRTAATTLGVTMLDHVIVTEQPSAYFSYGDAGWPGDSDNVRTLRAAA
jgi:DNA repair protein RadC